MRNTAPQNDSKEDVIIDLLNTHFKGEITEQKVAIKFLELGYMVSKPLVQCSRYDFIVDINHHLYKIQVKTCKITDHYIEFCTSTSHTNSKGTTNKSYDPQDVDFFATIQQDECYLIPYVEAGKRAQRLHTFPTQNQQAKNVRQANDYTIKNVIARI